LAKQSSAPQNPGRFFNVPSGREAYIASGHRVVDLDDDILKVLPSGLLTSVPCS
jgi:hypothetical protein